MDSRQFRELEQRAKVLLDALFDAAGDGCHVLTGGGGPLSFSLHFHNQGTVTHLSVGAELEDALMTATFAVTEAGGAFILRTPRDDGTARLWGWRISDGDAKPLTSLWLRNAYAVDHETGDLIPPEPRACYEDAPCLHLSR
ncbi:hypothetical protein ACIA6C_32630 [Streptomyces sp. NPDC051578]|uniref:hypothetical protein n=1 Tax=Streptomyces sp. NPDC051578 TaxID=3365662 RepID=UPI0037A19E35